MGVASGCGEQEVGVASGSGWNLWVWLLGVVLRRYIDFLILLIPTPRSSKVNTSISEGRHIVTSIFESRHIYHRSSKVDASIFGGNITPTIRRRILSTTALLYKFLE